jgi:hypothetical protein
VVKRCIGNAGGKKTGGEKASGEFNGQQSFLVMQEWL